MTTIKIINKSNNDLPAYETSGSAGMDIRSYLGPEPDSSIQIEPMERKLIKTGLYIEMPQEYECQVRSRSGLSLKHGITVLNAPGTIDSDYRGEIGVVLINLSNETYVLHNNSRIAQLVFSKVEQVTLQPAIELSNTQRGEGGFGSTGS
jgi:dUTP pyrophosphatase